MTNQTSGSRVRVLMGLLLLALILRLAAGVVVRRQIRVRRGETAHTLFPDSRQFQAYAHNVLTQGTYVDNENRHAWRTPAYSLLLAGLYALAGDEPEAARLLTNLLDVLNVLLIWQLARRVFTDSAALWAAAMAAAYPFFIYFANLVLADTLGVSAVLLSTLAVVRWMGPGQQKEPLPDRRSLTPNAVLIGLALAFAVLVKAAFALLGVFFIAYLILCQILDRHAGMPLASEAVAKRANVGAACMRQRLAYGIPVMILAFCIGMAPWWIRNARVFGVFVPFSTMGGFTLFESNSEYADGGPNNNKIVFPRDWRQIMDALRDGRFDVTVVPAGRGCLSHLVVMAGRPYWTRELRSQILDENDLFSTTPIEEPLPYFVAPAPILELSADEMLKYDAQSWIWGNPWRFLALIPIKIGRTWNVWPNWAGASSWFYKLVSLCSYVPIMLLAFYGLWAYRARWREVYILLVPAVYLTCLHGVFMGSIRYRLPAMGCLIVLAAGGLEALTRKSR